MIVYSIPYQAMCSETHMFWQKKTIKYLKYAIFSE